MMFSRRMAILLAAIYMLSTFLGLSYVRVAYASSAPSSLLAGGLNLNQETALDDPKDAYGRLGTLIGVLLDIAIFVGALTALAFFVVGAIQWGTAKGGDGAAKGRTTMMYAAAGLILLAGVYIFMTYFSNILPLASASCVNDIRCEILTGGS